ncbi:arylsulfotransferase family protein [Sphingomicrobium astaxanthinifaciens]|uniref:arylsulfotransferase family protein n=1 Tax=Sphingomicrobium astaxanthinifaciens TaxID=1227949 RepID=UPI001FCB67A4|nr:arylsulfotransferase family protein [Sphingomicrobium astaxanthinifaciens]MCJ7421781.1 arylsulfotransferase family protein [Sphingomicrobium astaxanthinifaciens]
MSERGFRDRLPIYLLAAAGLALAGMYGAVGGWPFPQLVAQARTSYEIGQTVLGSRRPELFAREYDGEGLVAHDPARSAGGLTLVTGTFREGQAVRLLDAEGRIVHQWEVDFFEHFPDAREFVRDKRYPASHANYYLQGVHPFADGSVMLNYSHLAAIKLDVCSQPVWRVRAPLHHSISQNADGSFWVPSHRELDATPEAWIHPPHTRQGLEARTRDTHRYHDTVVRVSPEGEILAEVSVLEAVIKGGPEHEYFDSMARNPTDLTHLNDAVEVTPALAAKIDGVEAGDLLVSLRDYHTLAIIDPEDNALRWYKTGPWLRQHDPDITPEGNITLFNNRTRYLGQSQLMEYDPATDAARVLYPRAPEDRFYSWIMGTQQALPNGNFLLTESAAGRVIEVTRAGEVVWDYRMPYDDADAAMITEAIRLPTDFYDTEIPQCPR